MDPITIAGAAMSVAPTIARWFTGRSQRRRANRINPVDPGFQANTGVMDNQRFINNYYNNYQLPGMDQMLSRLGSNYATALGMATQGASSSGDILDAVSRLSYGQNQAINALGIQSAQARERLIPMVMDANAAAGNELVRRNEFDNMRYQQELQEKAALEQAGAINSFGAFDALSTLGGSLLNYKAKPWTPQGPGKIDVLSSIFGS